MALKNVKDAETIFEIKKQIADKANAVFIKAQKEVDETITKINKIMLEV